MDGTWCTRKFNGIDLLDCNEAELLSSVLSQAYFYEICLLLMLYHEMRLNNKEYFAFFDLM